MNIYVYSSFLIWKNKRKEFIVKYHIRIILQNLEIGFPKLQFLNTQPITIIWFHFKETTKSQFWRRKTIIMCLFMCNKYSSISLTSFINPNHCNRKLCFYIFHGPFSQKWIEKISITFSPGQKKSSICFSMKLDLRKIDSWLVTEYVGRLNGLV